MKYIPNEYEDKRIALLGTILTIILFILFLTFVFYKANVEAQKEVDARLSEVKSDLKNISERLDYAEELLSEIKANGLVGHAVSRER